MITVVSTTSSASCRCCRHRLTAGAVSHHDLSSTISANWCTLFSGKPNRFCTTEVSSRILSNAQPCVARGSINSIVSASETSSRRPRHPQAQWGLSLCGHGHVHLAIETLLLMDLHRGGSSPLARPPLGQGTDSKQTPSSYTVWMVDVGVSNAAGAYTLDQNLEYGEPLPFRCLLDAGAWCCLTTALVLNM